MLPWTIKKDDHLYLVAGSWQEMQPHHNKPFKSEKSCATLLFMLHPFVFK